MAPDSEPTPRVPWLPVSAGSQAPTPAPAEPLTPTKPPLPAWIQRDDVPQPVADDGEDGDSTVVSPVSPPSADEVLPPLGVETTSPHDAAFAPPSGPVQLLGEAAVASAALSAGGAPTPLGGVPLTPTEGAVTVPAFGDESPAFTPTFWEQGTQQQGARAAEPPHGARNDALTADFLPDEQARIAAQASALDAGAAYEPRAFAEDAETEVMAAVPFIDEPEPLATIVAEPPAPAPVEEDQEQPPKRRSRWWIWALIALLLVGGAVATYLVLNKPEATVIPGATITQPPPSPTIDPIPAPTGSDFQAAMPTTVGTYALAGATALDPTDVALGMGRIADGVDLTYRSGTDTMSVRAVQYYNEADATEMFTHFVGDGAATQPVEASGVTVGESAIVTSPKPGMVWRNGTTLFILTGPPGQITEFYAQFGL